jgi:hypothetical protein
LTNCQSRGDFFLNISVLWKRDSGSLSSSDVIKKKEQGNERENRGRRKERVREVSTSLLLPIVLSFGNSYLTVVFTLHQLLLLPLKNAVAIFLINKFQLIHM